MAKDLLLEIGTEEIPAKFMPGALSQLAEIAKNKLNEHRIICKEIRTFGTPRRMVLAVKGVEEYQPDTKLENKGPSIKIAFDANGMPTKAGLGFARGQGVEAQELVQRDGYVYAVKEIKGMQVKELLPTVLSDMIHIMSFPKNMRWGSLDMKFVRPIRWLVALFGNEVIPFTIASVVTGNMTKGHRFMSKGEISITDMADYFNKMSLNYVMVNQNERRQVIKEQVEKLAAQHGGIADIDEELLEEVVYLVEYPTALCGKFDDDFLVLPKEVIITPMREHQRYFPVVAPDGKLMPIFITVRNGGTEHIDIVSHGNERVLKARLSDAKFFFTEDQKIKLIERIEKLKTIVFQEGLGTLYDKTLRLERLSVEIAKSIGQNVDLAFVERSAKLCKADLTTNMVYEFTELQGVMGRDYALLNGEVPAVADAIYEHYLPRFAGDVLPESTIGRALSIADKIDNIVATFSRGLIPTGSQDPYALRRQAIGIVNTLIDAKYHISLTKLTEFDMALLGITENEHRNELIKNIHDFFNLRIKNLLSEEQLRYDMIDALMAANTDDIYDTWLRAKALSLEGGTIAMQKAVQAFTRAGNLAKNAATDNIDPTLFETDAERNLYDAYTKAKEDIDKLTSEKRYTEVLKTMAEMTGPIDEFFGAVMVMVDNELVKNNRLAMLRAITSLTDKIADLSKIIVM